MPAGGPGSLIADAVSAQPSAAGGTGGGDSKSQLLSQLNRVCTQHHNQTDSRLSVYSYASDTGAVRLRMREGCFASTASGVQASSQRCRIILTIVRFACVCPHRRYALQGDAATSGLKRVTDDMKTKNRADRSGVVPVSAPSKGGAGAGKAGAAPRGPARFELEAGRKWVVENQTGSRGIVIEETDPKQTVYIYNCTDCTIQAHTPACCFVSKT